jgi:tetratricopeptide (TPR) repeat protein
LKIQPNDDAAHALRGHAFYLQGNLFDSEESYIDALRIRAEKYKAQVKSGQSSTNALSPSRTLKKGKNERKASSNMMKSGTPANLKNTGESQPQMQVAGPPSDPVLQERLGLVYAQRKSWNDSRTVFRKACKERMSTTAWIYLGMSLLRLGEVIAAEDAIDQANILDNQNCLSWALSSLICLQ